MTPVNIIAGLPRSGTSMAAQVTRVMYGADRFHGDEYPLEAAIKRFEERGEDETEAGYENRILANQRPLLDAKKAIKGRRELNPLGFYEDGDFVAYGLNFRLPLREKLDELTDVPSGSARFIKLVSMGLTRSDPRYIGGVLFMAREPLAQTRSSQELQDVPHTFQFTDGRLQDLYRGRNPNAPESYIKQLLNCAHWFDMFPDIPVEVVDYDDAIRNKSVLPATLRKLFGPGKQVDARKAIDPSLKRSRQERTGPIWDDARQCYEWFLEKNWAALIEYTDRIDTAFKYEVDAWPCVRAGAPVASRTCEECMQGGTLMKKLKAHAKLRGIRWQGRPCRWETELRKDGVPLITNRESIENNHWRTDRAAAGDKE